MASNEAIVVLNDSQETSEDANVTELMSSLRKVILQLKADFISEDGSGVNYKGMGQSKIFTQYKKLAGNLRTIELEYLKANEQERKAFFINLYNVQMIHGLIAQEDLPEAPTKVQGMWTNLAYNVGGLFFTLDEIEHGVLRCNKGHPKDGGQPTFGVKSDARLELVLTHFDPRIHFALNCGAQSCPPIRVYSADKLDKQLQMASNSFCNQEIQVLEDKEDQVLVSKLLMWYKSDFGKTDNEVLEKLCEFISNETLREAVMNIVAIKNVNNKIVYKNYDWSLNSK